jgi:hypothetical protein
MHTLSSSSSSEIEDQITTVFSGVMDQAMSILAVEEGSSEMKHSRSGSSSTRRLKRHRCYVNRNHEAAHLRLQHD